MREIRFRELTSPEDLKASFQLRERVYLGTGLYNAPKPGGIDVDEFDLRSRFIGAFSTEGGESRLVASCRMVLPAGGEYRLPPVADVLPASLLPSRSQHELLPSQVEFDFSDVLPKRAEGGPPIVEFSRMVCLPGIRGGGIGKGLVHCLYAMARSVGAEIGLGATPYRFRTFYEQHGCRILGDFINPNFHLPLLALVVHLRELPPAMRGVEKLEHLLRTEGRLDVRGSALGVEPVAVGGRGSRSRESSTKAATAARRVSGLEYRPRIFKGARKEDREALRDLESSGAVFSRHDTLELQLEELAKIRFPNPELRARRGELVRDFVAGRDPDEIGDWVYYPWNGTVVHLLGASEIAELRTSRNKNKITEEEQARLAKRVIGVIGLSVGNAAALVLATERVCGAIKLADFDALETSNLNRLRAGLADLGVNKAILAARQIAEIDPYLEVHAFPDGVDGDSLDAFFDETPRLDLLVEECDTPYVKLLAREKARDRGIPVLMVVDDRGLLDVERFDLEPERPVFHGLLGDMTGRDLVGADPVLKRTAVMKMIGLRSISDRGSGSCLEIDETLVGWPQLASEVALGAATAATTARAILLGQTAPSGRYYVEVPFGVDIEERPAVATEGRAGGADSAAQQEKRRRLEMLDRDLREILDLAMCATSAANAQPWRFVVRDRRIDVVLDEARTKTYRLFDCKGTPSRLSLGAAAENIVLAARARGLETEVEYDPLGESDPTHVRISLGREARSPDEKAASLASFIRVRATYRERTQGRPLAPAELEALLASVRPLGARVWITDTDAARRCLGETAGAANRLHLLVKEQHASFLEEFYFREEHPGRRYGMPIDTFSLEFDEEAGFKLLERPQVAAFLRRRGEGDGLRKLGRESCAVASAVGAIGPSGSARARWVEAGRALQRLWLEATALGIGLHPNTSMTYNEEMLDSPEGEIYTAEERAEIRRHMREVREHIVGEPRAPVAILFRLTAGIDLDGVPRAPRGDLADHLELES